LGGGLTTYPCTKALVTETQRMSLGGVKRRRTWRCLKIGTWNVLSLYRPGASNILEKQWSICEKIMKEAAESAIGVMRDAERLGVRNWRRKVKDRDGWRRILESAKTLHRL
jgi:hypothetical protein